MHLSRIGFLSRLKSLRTGLSDECPGNRPVMYHLVKLEHLRTSRVWVCAAIETCNAYSSTTQGCDNHRREQGRRHLEGVFFVFLNITSVTFLYLDVTRRQIWGESVCDWERGGKAKKLNISRRFYRWLRSKLHSWLEARWGEVKGRVRRCFSQLFQLGRSRWYCYTAALCGLSSSVYCLHKAHGHTSLCEQRWEGGDAALSLSALLWHQLVFLYSTCEDHNLHSVTAQHTKRTLHILCFPPPVFLASIS